MGFDSIIGEANLLAESANPYVAAAQTADQMLQKIFNTIGHGRREADQIVPLQNQVGDLLGQINRAIDDPATTIDDLRRMRTQLGEAGRQFVAFTRDARFKDGRASQQARLTIMPLLDGTDGSGNIVTTDLWNNPVDGGTIRSIDRGIVARGGTVNDPKLAAAAGSGSGGSGGVLLALAAIVPFLLQD